MFVNTKSQPYNHVDKLADIESQLGHQGNQYLFLRSIWQSHSHLYANTIVDLDDQLDRLNKIVGMMKKHIMYSAKKQLCFQNNNCYEEVSVRQCKAIQAMSKAMLQSQQYRTRLSQALAQNQLLTSTNKQFRQQILQLKQKRKQDRRTIKQLTQKTAKLQNKILVSGYQQSKSQISIMRSSTRLDKENNSMKQSTVRNYSIIQIPNTIITSTKKIYNNRYSNQQSDQKWLNQTSMIQEDLDSSRLSISSYGIFANLQPNINRISSYTENKQNFEDIRSNFHYQSQRNLLKQRSLKKNRVMEVTKNQINAHGESPKQGIKFIRQNSKKALLRKSQKISDTCTGNQMSK